MSIFKAGAGLLSAFSLVACESAADRYDEQFEMLDDVSAGMNEKCDLASEAAESAFTNYERDAFEKWSKIKDDVCSSRDTLSVEEVYGAE